MTDDFKNDALIFRAFSDENRLKIINEIKNGEVCACYLLRTLTISQSTLSHHMKILVDSGIVNARKDGKWTRYSISKEGIENAKKLIDTISTPDYKSNNVCRCKRKAKIFQDENTKTES